MLSYRYPAVGVGGNVAWAVNGKGGGGSWHGQVVVSSSPSSLPWLSDSERVKFLWCYSRGPDSMMITRGQVAQDFPWLFVYGHFEHSLNIVRLPFLMMR